MSEEFNTDLGVREDYQRMYKQALQFLYSAQDLVSELPDFQTEQNTIEHAIHALESSTDKFSDDDWLSRNFPCV
jgi:hypothetical protein|tara:strand:- start:1157 stop:1378 length:222 start_codon:yes stop_codon:yes gene_type:complete